MVCFSSAPKRGFLFPKAGHDGAVYCFNLEGGIELVVLPGLGDRGSSTCIQEDPLLTDMVKKTRTDVDFIFVLQGEQGSFM